MDSPSNQMAIPLLEQLTETRKSLGLSQAELASRSGVSRMTVQRMEADGADPQLSTFLTIAQVLQMSLCLEASALKTQCSPLPKELSHRGLYHARTQYDTQYRDREREAAFAKNWEAASIINDSTPAGVLPLLSELVPGCTQAQASAAATVMQWLGSSVGFEFLEKSLALAGYSIVDERVD